MHEVITDEQNKKKGGWASIIPILIFIAFLGIAMIVWNTLKNITKSIEEKWADPLAKDETLRQSEYATKLSGLLFLIPLILGAISAIMYVSKSAKSKHEVETEEIDDHSHDYRPRTKPVVFSCTKNSLPY